MKDSKRCPEAMPEQREGRPQKAGQHANGELELADQNTSPKLQQRGDRYEASLHRSKRSRTDYRTDGPAVIEVHRLPAGSRGAQRVPDEAIRNKQLSLAAVGLLVRLLADGHEFASIDAIARHYGHEGGGSQKRGRGREAYRLAAAELESAGHLMRERVPSATGLPTTRIQAFAKPCLDAPQQPRRRVLMPHEQPTALYHCFSAQGRLLYVGISNNPPERYRQHAKQDVWWVQVCKTKIRWFDGRPEAEAMELKEIWQKRPPYNRQVRPPRRPSGGRS